MIATDSVDYLIALRVERDGADGLPVARLPTPARRMSLPGAFVDLVSGRQDLVVMPFMARGRADVADTAVQMSMVVPVHELRRPVACGLQVSKATRREFGVLSRNRRKFRQPINVACPAPGRWGRPNSRVTSRHFDHGNASRTSRPDCSGLDEAD